MFFDPRVTKVFIYTPPVDCRKAHNGLIFIVTNVMTQEFASGDIFLFVSKDRKTVKALKWDGTGAICFHKKMENGRIMKFENLSHTEKSAPVQITSEELMGIISGGKVRLDLKI